MQPKVADTSSKAAGLERSYKNIPEMFLDRVAVTPNREAYRYPKGHTWHSLTWAEAAERVRHIAHGLLSLGVELEQRCAIVSSTRIEWVLADLGILCAGAATTTVYPSNTPDECAFILSDSETRYIFAEDEGQLAKLREKKDELPALQKVILFTAKSDDVSDGDWVITLDELEKLGAEHAKENPEAIAELAEKLEAEHLATLIYTSGTTGKPKGVRLVHDCWTYEAEGIKAMGILDPSDLQYLWLPLSHSFGKVLEAASIAIGFPTAIDGNIPRLVDNLSIVRPTFMAAAPRIFEKVYNKVVAGAQESKLKSLIFSWAIGVGTEVSRLRQKGSQPRGLLAIKYMIADKLVFSKLKERFGGRVKFFISGSAPLSKEIAEFFHAADILILEGYGLTETSAASFVNRPERYRFGTVGDPLPGTEVQIAEEDGEILIRSPGVMRGYHNLPDKTAELLGDDGWLHTGDIGEIDADGFLEITDRKKDLIKTSGGKYVAPQRIEGAFKVHCTLASQVIVHGDRRNFCSALITLDEEAVTEWARDHQLGRLSYEELTEHPKVRSVVQSAIDEMNADLASYETIKKFAILPRDLTVEDGDLTPSLKVKRKAVEKKFMHILDGMYEGTIARH